MLELLNQGADVNAKVGILFTKSSEQRTNVTPLHLAAANNVPAVALLLLEYGAIIDARDDTDATPLHFAAWVNSDPAVASQLLDRGANPNARENRDYTPLHFAATGNLNPAMVALLLDNGADPNSKAQRGYTPLHFAAWVNPEPAVTALLLDRGADANAEDEIIGYTPCQLAHQNQNLAGEPVLDRLCNP